MRDEPGPEYSPTGGEAWRRLARRLGVDLRPGEEGPALLLFVAFFLFVSFQYATKSIRQSTFVDSLGSEKLPFVYLLVALCSYPFLRLYSRLLEKLPSRSLIPGTCVVIAASMVGFWWLYRYPWPIVPFVFYLWLSIVFAMTMSQLWSLANTTFDPRQAKRLFGFVGAGGLLGGIAGGQVARLSAGVGGTGSGLLVAGALILGTGVATLLMHRFAGPREGPTEELGPASMEKARSGLRALRDSHHLRLIATILALSVIVGQIIDLQFNWAVEQITTTLDQRTAYFGNLYTVIGLAAFLFQLLFTSRIHQSLGVGVALRVMPFAMALGTGGVLTAAALAPAALVQAAVTLKVGENGLRYSLDQATRELLFLPVPPRLRASAKAFIDVFIQRGAKGVAALLLLPVTFGLISPDKAGWLALVLAAIWLLVTRSTQREYVRSFRRGLRQRRVDTLSPIHLSDATTLELLIQSLGSSDPRQVLYSLEILSSHGRGHLVIPLLLLHDDAEVRCRTLEVLADAGRDDAVPLVEKLLKDPEPEVRAVAIRALADLSGRDACEVMLNRLDEVDSEVRAAAVACLVNLGDESMVQRATDRLQQMLTDARADVRCEAAKAISEIPEPSFQKFLVQLLCDADPAVAREAIKAVRKRAHDGAASPLYPPILISLLRNRRLKHDARQALTGFGEGVIPSLVHFLNAPEEDIWVKRALPKTLAQIGTRGAATVLLDCLERSSDAFLRRKAVEALGSFDLRVDKEETRRIMDLCRSEARGYFETLSQLLSLGVTQRARLEGPLFSWSSDSAEPDLLEQLLCERLADYLRNIFGLLALLFEPEAIRAAYRSLLGRRRDRRSHALEFLDNTLPGDLKRDLFPVFDDLPLEVKLQHAEHLLGAPPAPRAETIHRIVTSSSTASDLSFALPAAAAYAVYHDGLRDLVPDLQVMAAEAGDVFSRETAAWALMRIERTS